MPTATLLSPFWTQNDVIQKIKFTWAVGVRNDCIREYASTPYIGMTQSSHWLNSRIKHALFFLSSTHHDENFSSSRYYFSHFFPKISSLYLAKPRKYGLLQFWRFHLGCSIHHLLLLILHHKTKFLRSISPKQCDIESWNMRQNVWFDGLQCTVTMTRDQRA